MASLIESILGELTKGPALEQLGARVGADREKTGAAAGAAVTALLGALARNSSRPDGAAALDAALAKDHDGSVLNDIRSHLTSADRSGGDNILRHVLGAKRPAIEAGLGSSTGLDGDSMGQIMAMLAPVVLGALGKQKREQGLDASALAGLLGGERRELEQRQPQAMGALTGLLDTDGDGDVDISDLAKHGKGLLGRFLKGR